MDPGYLSSLNSLAVIYYLSHPQGHQEHERQRERCLRYMDLRGCSSVRRDHFHRNTLMQKACFTKDNIRFGMCHGKIFISYKRAIFGDYSNHCRMKGAWVDRELLRIDTPPYFQQNNAVCETRLHTSCSKGACTCTIQLLEDSTVAWPGHMNRQLRQRRAVGTRGGCCIHVLWHYPLNIGMTISVNAYI